jgi:hypothetical protein
MLTDLPDGVLDLHVHVAPDGAQRRVDALGLARAGGLAGAVFKGHHAPTAAIALLTRQEVPGFAAIGAVTLNHSVGGLNPDAVVALATLGGAAAGFVWLPTRDAANDIARKGRAGRPVQVVEGSRPVAELFAVAEATLAHGLVLASGHLAPAETVAVFAALAPTGVQRVATHVTAAVTPFSDEDLSAVLRSGALAEICARNLLVRRPDMAQADTDRIAAAAALIRRFGPAQFILSSDLGDLRYPAPVAGLAAIVQALGHAGIDDAALEQMLVATPRRIISNALTENTP